MFHRGISPMSCKTELLHGHWFVTKLQTYKKFTSSLLFFYSGQAKVARELTGFQMSESSSPEAHAPAVTLQMPHLPVTAVTRTSEKFTGENVCLTGTTNASSCLLGQGKSTNTMGVKSSNRPGKRQKKNFLKLHPVSFLQLVLWILSHDLVVIMKPCFYGYISHCGTLQFGVSAGADVTSAENFCA